MKSNKTLRPNHGKEKTFQPLLMFLLHFPDFIYPILQLQIQPTYIRMLKNVKSSQRKEIIVSGVKKEELGVECVA
jgi:hypothetical protein